MADTEKKKKKKLTPPEVAKDLRVSDQKVLALINSGELRAINVADPKSRRPRYRIDVEDLKAFEESRRVVPKTTTAQANRLRRKHPGTVTEFF